MFSNEKRFSFNGLDDWRLYMQRITINYHIKRQCGCGAVMVWIMAMPNVLLSFKVIKGTMNSGEYIKLLSEKVVLIIKLNYFDNYNWYLQEDMSLVHKSQKVQNFVKNSEISAKNIDLNIVEDCWKTISDLVYDGYQF